MQLPEDDFLKSFYSPLAIKKALAWIAILGFVIYSNSLFNPFVWDDITQIVNNTVVHSFTNILQIFTGGSFLNVGASTSLQGFYYRPIMSSIFAIIYSFFGPNVFFFHLIQISLHIINVSLVFLFLRKFLNKPLSFLLSLLFLVHPINQETVVYVSSFQDILFFFFGMFGLIILSFKKVTLRNLILINILLLSSLLSKETGIVFVFVTLLYALLFIKGSFLKLLIINFFSLAEYFFLRFFVAKIYFTSPSHNPIAHIGLIKRLFNIPSIAFYYIKTLFFPIRLSIDQKWIINSIGIKNFYTPLFIDLLFFLAIFLIGVIVFRKNRKSFPTFVLFLAWFAAGLFLHLQLFPLDMTVADRWFYFPMVGLLGLVGITLKQLNITHSKIKEISLGVGVFILILLSMRTMVRNTNWFDPITLYEHDIQFNDNRDLEQSLALEYFHKGTYNESLKHYLKAQNLAPDESNLFDIGHIYEIQGNTQKAKEYYFAGLHMNTLSPQSHKLVTTMIYARLAEISLANNASESARQTISMAMTKYPDSWVLWFELAIIDSKLNNKQAAITEAKKAKEYFPSEFTNNFYQALLNN